MFNANVQCNVIAVDEYVWLTQRNNDYMGIVLAIV